MECLRCGTCCTRHPAFATPEEIARIIAYLGITPDDWERDYAGEGPDYFRYRPIRQTDGACVFLKKDGDRYACAVHPVKPDCCVKWEPDPDRPECREGMRRLGKVKG